MDERWDFDGSARAHDRGDAGGRRRDLAGDVRRSAMARPRRLPRARRAAHRRSAAGATRRSTRSSRAPRSRPTCCSSASTATASPPSRAAPGAHARASRRSASSARCATTISPPTTAASASRFEAAIGAVRRPSPTGRALRAVRVPRRVRRALGAEDHLVLVAGIRREQVVRLRDGGRADADGARASAPDARIDRLAPHTFETLRDQAALQLAASDDGRPRLARAAQSRPSAASTRCRDRRRATSIFDIEGDPFWEPARGLHFLFGLLLRGRRPDWQYRPIWAHDRDGRAPGVRERSSISSTRGWPPIPTCTSTTTAPTRTPRSSS